MFRRAVLRLAPLQTVSAGFRNKTAVLLGHCSTILRKWQETLDIIEYFVTMNSVVLCFKTLFHSMKQFNNRDASFPLNLLQTRTKGRIVHAGSIETD